MQTFEIFLHDSLQRLVYGLQGTRLNIPVIGGSGSVKQLALKFTLHLELT